MDKSILIFFATPVFLILILIEYLYGYKIGKNNYRLNDAFTSISLGLISRFPTILNLGFQSAAFIYAADQFNLRLLPNDSALTWIIAFFLYDLSYYWMHRLHHEIKLLWATHVVHHHGEDFNLATALRQTSSGFLWKWIFFIPMIAIGIPVDVFVSVAGVNLVYQFWVHTKHIGHLGFLEKIFITPMNHSIHHAKNKEYIDANYGGVFIIWDRMFGTYIPERADIKPIYGTVKPLNSWNPIWANLQVFYQMIKDTIKTKNISDKLKIWYGSTHWLPDDLEKNRNIITAENFSKKYNPRISNDQKLFGLVQLILIIFISFYVSLTLSEQTNMETAIFGLAIVLSATITSILFQGSEIAYKLHFLLSIVTIFAVYVTNFIDSALIAAQLISLQAVINIFFISLHKPLHNILNTKNT